MRFFNTAGPCNPDDHYMLPAAARLADEQVFRLIETKSYFIVHAPRQTGKTTAMHELARQLTASGKYISALLSMEVGAGLPDDVGAAELAILNDWRDAIRYQLPAEFHPSTWKTDADAGRRIGNFLAEWAISASRPLIIFLDEIDALANDALISVLRQLRSGYFRRPVAFPSSLALIGLRDIRDYKVASGGSDRLSTPSPFNISVRSITLRNFNLDEVAALLRQHCDESGQPFTPACVRQIYELTQGQPWLVNALAKVAVEELVTDLAQPVTEAHIEIATELLIQRRQTHLGQLADKLREDRVHRVIEPILAGGSLEAVPQDDIEYVLDLGLCRWQTDGGLVIANPIYREVLPRVLSYTARASLPQIAPTWLTVEGRLDTQRLLDAFLAFWRQHGQPLLKTTHYHEIAPHLVLMAFLDRVVNGGGTIVREYAIGIDKMDLFLRYGVDRLAMELKVWRDGKPDPLPQGLAQLDGYLNGLGLETGWLIIFDQRKGLPDISERTTTTITTTLAGRSVTVIRG
jgi:type II secretory pathway predicted ATPase ExeA